MKSSLFFKARKFNGFTGLRAAGIAILILVVQLTVVSQTTFYIDPSFSGSPQNGTVSNPYSSWSQVSFANGNTYLQKRGTTFVTSGKLFLYQKSNITIGAYGEGARPLFYSTGGSGNKVVDLGFTQNCTVRDMEIASSGDATTCVYFAGSTSYNNTIDNCILRNSQWGFRATAGFDKLSLLNTEIHTTADDGVFIQDVTNVEISNCNIHDVNMNWYYVGQSQSQAAGDGIQLLGNCNNFIIHNNTIDRSNSGNKFAIIVNSTAPNTATGRITHNTITTPLLAPDGGAGIYIGTGDNILVEHNTVQGELDGLYNHSTNLRVLGNVFKNLPVGVNTLNSSSVCMIINNTFYNIRTHIKGANINVKNNTFFYSQSGDVAIYKYYPYALSETNNCYSSGQGGNNSVIGNPLFIDAPNGNFRLQSNSPCINHGTSTIMLEDMDGNPVPQGNIPEIGAFEKIESGSSNLPPVISDQTFGIAENSQAGALVGNVIASDPDPNQTLSFSIVSGNTNNAFSIHASSGALSVANPAALNFELTPVFQLVIRVQDNGVGNLSASANITINLSNVNEAPVINAQTFTVNENAAAGTIAGTMSATDPDQGQNLSFSIVSGNLNNAFTIHATNGTISVSNSQALNYEAVQSITLSIRVTDNGSPSLMSTANAQINILNQNEAPVITAGQSFLINEHSPAGTQTGIVAATDQDAGQSLTFSIISGNTNNAFAIAPSTGMISVNGFICFESCSSYTLTIRATDNGSPVLWDEKTVAIHLTDINENPVIADQSFGVESNSPNGTFVGTVLAEDPDFNQALSYSFTDGNISGAFFIDAANGNITVANSSAVNYLIHPQFILTVKVQDNGAPQLASYASVTINVGEVNNAPQIQNQSFSINENSLLNTVVGQISASDPDPGQMLDFAITAGNTGEAFQVSSTGLLTIANPEILNYESIQSFQLSVEVTDNGTPSLSAIALITISVSDVNEAPVFTGNPSFSVAEHVSEGTQVGIVSATDPDSGQSLVFSIVGGNTGNAFSISASSGVLSVSGNVCFETCPQYALVVRVSDNASPALWSEQTFVVMITDVNENPLISNQMFEVESYAAAGTIVGTILASDPDFNQMLSYSIESGNLSNAFSIEPATGILTVSNSSAVNYITHPLFELTIKVQDNGNPSLSSLAQVSIVIHPVNSQPEIANQTYQTDENPANGYIIGQVVASDPDPGQILTYAIHSGNTGNAFQIGIGGLLSVANASMLDFETNAIFNLEIYVTDNGTPSESASAIITVTLNDLNENPELPANQTLSVNEHVSAGTMVGYVSAEDQDAGQLLNFSIMAGNTNNAFIIEPSTGKISVNGFVCFENCGQYDLTVKVSDNGTPSLYTQNVVNIQLNDINESPVINNLNIDLQAFASNGTEVAIIAASDPDFNQNLAFSITSGNDNGAFVINPATGLLSVANSEALNPETTPVFALTVTVQDNGTPSLSSSAQVNITLNSGNSAPSIDNQTFTIFENTPNGSLVGQLIATDPDFGQTMSWNITAGNEQGVFSLNQQGKLSVINNQLLDFESVTQFNLTVNVTDNGTPAGSASALIVINIQDINEAPEFANQSFSMAENSPVGSSPGRVEATDPDINQRVTFSLIESSISNAFSVALYNGGISVINSDLLDYESNPVIILTIRATDNSPEHLYTDAIITIQLSDVNEVPVVTNSTFNVIQRSRVGTFVGQVIANDPDAGQTLSYSIAGGNTSSAFRVDAATGIITVNNAGAINPATNPVFYLRIRVYDNGSPTRYSDGTMTIRVVKKKDGENEIAAEENDAAIIQYNVYPNPSSNGQFTVEFSSLTNPAEIKVFDLSGRVVFSETSEQSNLKQAIDLSNMNTGMYLLRISDGTNTKTTKLIKQ
ncbi:MAG: cadherin domain-containing protein [Lentimicrobiaceae bacterium]|nr:cadherin domain-containing protein [Lentimicrobiaceae bacterium]